MNYILLFTLCVIPSLLLLLYIYTKDKIEKEPLLLLIILFIGGMLAEIIATSLSSILKYYVYFLSFNYSNMNAFQLIFKNLVVIAFIEEASKWSVIFLATWKNKNFNHIFDPIVYSLFATLGFATYENIMYAFAFSSHGFMPILMRGIISVPIHAVFGVFMGYYLGIAKNAEMYNKKKKTKKYIVLSLVAPVLIHFIYNLLLIRANTFMYYAFIVYVILLYFLAFIIINKLSKFHKMFIKNDTLK